MHKQQWRPEEQPDAGEVCVNNALFWVDEALRMTRTGLIGDKLLAAKQLIDSAKVDLVSLKPITR